VLDASCCLQTRSELAELLLKEGVDHANNGGRVRATDNLLCHRAYMTVTHPSYSCLTGLTYAERAGGRSPAQ
jgi:hypothetical protein